MPESASWREVALTAVPHRNRNMPPVQSADFHPGAADRAAAWRPGREVFTVAEPRGTCSKCSRRTQRSHVLPILHWSGQRLDRQEGGGTGVLFLDQSPYAGEPVRHRLGAQPAAGPPSDRDGCAVHGDERPQERTKEHVLGLGTCEHSRRVDGGDVRGPARERRQRLCVCRCRGHLRALGALVNPRHSCAGSPPGKSAAFGVICLALGLHRGYSRGAPHTPAVCAGCRGSENGGHVAFRGPWATSPPNAFYTEAEVAASAAPEPRDKLDQIAVTDRGDSGSLSQFGFAGSTTSL